MQNMLDIFCGLCSIYLTLLAKTASMRSLLQEEKDSQLQERLNVAYIWPLLPPVLPLKRSFKINQDFDAHCFITHLNSNYNTMFNHLGLFLLKLK